MVKRTHWKLWLPLMQVVIAIGLSLVGKAEYEHKFSNQDMSWGGTQAWDYLPSADIVLHSINYPAAIATTLTSKHHPLRIGIKYSLKIFVIYIAYIVVLWYAVGWYLETLIHSSTANSKGSIWLALLGLLVGGVLLFSAVGIFRIASALVIVASAFLWSIAFLSCSSNMLLRIVRAQTQKTI